MKSDTIWDLTSIECLLLDVIHPSYIETSLQDGYLYILVSKPVFKDYSISERQQSIRDLLKNEMPEILRKYDIIIDVLDESELTELFKRYVEVL